MDTAVPVDAEIAPRKPWLAGLLGLFFPGLGHLYVGRATQGLMLVGVYYGLLSLLAAVGYQRTLWGDTAVLGGCILYRLLAIIQPTLTAFRQPVQDQRRYMRLPVYLVYTLVSFVAVDLLLSSPLALLTHGRGSVVRIPGESMSPTFVRGDILVVDRHAYDARLPAPNDLVVISARAPGSSEEVEYVRRVKSVVSDPTSASPMVELTPDNLRFEFEELKVLPATKVTGRVTRIIWSHDFRRIGRRFQ